MAYNLLTMRQLVRSRLDDEDFEQEYLDQAINEAQWDILEGLSLSINEVRVTATLLTGGTSVPYPTDMMGEPISIRLNSATVQQYEIKDKFVDFDTFQNSVLDTSFMPSSVPYLWTTFAGEMLFMSKATEDFTVTFYYMKEAPALTLETDVPMIPERFQELLKIGAYMRIAKREDDYDVKDAEMQDYARKRLQLIHAYARDRGPNRKRIMRTMGR